MLGSDVSVGSFLSGGLDPSSIVCPMAEFLDPTAMDRRVYGVGACYGEKGVDEKPLIDAVAMHTRSKNALAKMGHAYAQLDTVPNPPLKES
jgi:asparagine synthase (glutamine-hydrolysing)